MPSELDELFISVQLEVRLLRSRIIAEAPLNVAFNQELTKVEGQMERCWDESLRIATSQRSATADTVQVIRQNLEGVRAKIRQMIGFLDDRKRPVLELPRLILTPPVNAATMPSPTPSVASSALSSASTQYSAVKYYHSGPLSSPAGASALSSSNSSSLSSSTVVFDGMFGPISGMSPVPPIYWSTTPPPRPLTPARDRTPISSTDSGYFGSSSSSRSSFNPQYCSTPKYHPLPLKRAKRE